MHAITRVSILTAMVLGAVRGVAGQEPGATSGPPQARRIPGLTVEDAFPRACVDCHVNLPDRGMDMRISTLMSRWTTAVEPALLARAQLVMPPGVRLVGVHPRATSSLSDIPAGCMDCHGGGAASAPPFAGLLHVIHLTGGEENHFLTEFQGECTYCHKLDPTTGEWKVPSGAER